MSINSVTLVGRMVADVDLRYTPQGKAVGNFRLAVNRTYKNQNGEYEADFANCVVWGKQAENLASFMKKGSQVGVMGSIQTRSYENKQSQRVFVTEILVNQVTFLESKNKQSQGNSYQQQGNGNEGFPYQQNNQNQGNPFQNQPINTSNNDLSF
ncbi:single-stranded DNA-binding protein [Lentibacillus sp. N15]|uniref:single-stranded DNA-binding protein n=1 Tax=Lentibacillus songyuanensis TaxID=3136161 RepID=UPI0031BABCF5